MTVSVAGCYAENESCFRFVLFWFVMFGQQAPLWRMHDKDEVIGQRVFGCGLVQQMGILLRMPQVVTSTAQVMFHRFYAKRSLYKFDARVS